MICGEEEEGRDGHGRDVGKMKREGWGGEMRAMDLRGRWREIMRGERGGE